MMSKTAPDFSTALIQATRSAVAGVDARGVEALLEVAVQKGVADQAGISRCDPTLGRSFLTVAPTHEMVRIADRLQHGHRQGPFFETLYSEEVLTSPAVGSDARWPAWGPAAADLGIGAMTSVGLQVGCEKLGVLNLYNTATGRPGPAQVARAGLVGTAVSIVLAHFRGNEWATAVASSTLLGQAQGILMHEQTLTAGEAFQVMNGESFDRGTTLTELARR